jgi:hypothetical protein
VSERQRPAAVPLPRFRVTAAQHRFLCRVLYVSRPLADTDWVMRVHRPGEALNGSADPRPSTDHHRVPYRTFRQASGSGTTALVAPGTANGLLRDYSPKRTDLSIHSQHDLDQTSYSLNARPQQTLGWMTPSEKLAEALQ